MGLRNWHSQAVDPARVKQAGIVFTVARPNGAVPIETAAKLMQLTVTDMRKLATQEGLWYSPNHDGTVYAIARGIRGKYVDAFAFDKFRASLLRKESNAENFKARLTRDL